MNKILVTGITGQVGQELLQTLKDVGEIVGVARQQLDLSQPEQIYQAIAAIKPQIIINAAAYTAVDKAEKEVELAIAINATAPRVMAEAAQNIGATMVQISTDYVFDGEHNRPYTETDATNPLGVYGKSKLQGEIAVQSNCDRHIIIRTAWVYGSRGHGNFVKTMLRLGAAKEQLSVVADQIGSPTWSYDLASAISKLISQPDFNAPNSMGIYHFTNSGVASWYDFAVAIFAEARQLGFPLKIQQVIPITTTEYPTPAQRPAYSVLQNQKIAQKLGGYAPYWRESLQKMLIQWQSCQ